MVMLQSYCITNAKFESDNKIAYVCITDETMKRFNAQKDYTDGIVEVLRTIAPTEVAFVLNEINNDTVKASLRSKTIDVSLIASVFNGGGHAFAAGCTIKRPINIAKSRLLEEIKKYL
jgi:phosphoesterase RecJ-like protein